MMRLNEAMHDKDLDQKRYYTKRVMHWEAVMDCFRNFKDCGRLKEIIRKRQEELKEKKEEVSTAVGDEIVATGTFSKHNPGVRYRDATISCRIGIDKKGYCYILGKGHIKVQVGNETGDFYFTFGPSWPAFKSKPISRIPAQYAWEGKVKVDFQAGNMTFKGNCNWKATMKAGSIKGAILDLFELMGKTGLDAVASLLPSPLPFTLYYYKK